MKLSEFELKHGTVRREMADHHRLVDLGMTRRQAVATIHLACLAIGLPATVLGYLSEAQGLLIIGQGLLVLTLVALLERAGRKKTEGRKQ